MGVVKRSVSFEADVWDELVAAAGGAPVSPLVNDALAHYLRRQRALAAVAAYEVEYGGFTEAELAEADRVLDAAGVTDLTAPPAGPRGDRRRSRRVAASGGAGRRARR
jgi:hypothetical protein